MPREHVGDNGARTHGALRTAGAPRNEIGDLMGTPVTTTAAPSVVRR
jgi:hypothetical protein